MKALLHLLLPARADNTVRGVKLPVYVFTVIAAISTARSLIHLLAPDGGAGSIAGIDAVFRYRSLVPLTYALLILETLLRAFVGRTKPVPLTSTPPGATGNAVLLPLAVCMLALSLASASRQEEQVA